MTAHPCGPPTALLVVRLRHMFFVSLESTDASLRRLIEQRGEECYRPYASGKYRSSYVCLALLPDRSKAHTFFLGLLVANTPGSERISIGSSRLLDTLLGRMKSLLGRNKISLDSLSMSSRREIPSGSAYPYVQNRESEESYRASGRCETGNKLSVRLYRSKTAQKQIGRDCRLSSPATGTRGASGYHTYHSAASCPLYVYISLQTSTPNAHPRPQASLSSTGRCPTSTHPSTPQKKETLGLLSSPTSGTPAWIILTAISNR